jgi:hypothetical protein
MSKNAAGAPNVNAGMMENPLLVVLNSVLKKKVLSRCE